jgi:large subunit ribosomal protein L25
MESQLLLRKQGEKRKDHVSAIFYGHNLKSSINIFIPRKTVMLLQKSQSRILNIHIEEKSYKVMVKDVQYHPVKDHIIHIDLFNIDGEKLLKFPTKILFSNEKENESIKSGNRLNAMCKHIDILCKGNDIIEIIVCDLKNIIKGKTLYIRDLCFPENVKSLKPHKAVVSIIK